MKTFFHIFFFTLMMVLSGNNIAQNATIKGVVTDAFDSQPLTGVNIIADSAIIVSSNELGEYIIELSAGKYKLKFSFVGFQNEYRYVSLQKGEHLQLNIALKNVSFDLETAVVTASKYEQKLSEVTVSVSVMKPKFIQNLNAANMADAINYIPGIDILDGQASIRGGSGYSYGTGSRVMVLVDGLPILTAADEDVKWNALPIENIDQVEVLKGASSALYGSSALNGIINIRTLYPGPKPQTSFSIFNGIYLKPSRQELVWWWKTNPMFAGASFSHSRQIKKFDLVVGGNLFGNEGYRSDNYEQRARLNLKLRYRPQKLNGITYGLNTNLQFQKKSDFFIWVDADSGAFMQQSETVTPNDGVRFNVDPWVSYFDKKHNSHSLKTRYYLVSNNFDLNADKNNRSEMYYGEYQYQRTFVGQLNLTAGVSGLYGITNSNLYGDHYNSTISVYSQLDYKFFNKLSTSLGVRWERYTLDAKDENSGAVLRAGLNYQVAKSTFLRASFGQGYRFPSIAEKYTATSLGALNIFPNPELKPETGWSTEIGARQGFFVGNWSGFIDFAAFWMQYENMIEFSFGVYKPDTVEVPTLKDIGFKSRNVGNARITGFEIDLESSGTIGKIPVSISLGYTYMNPINLSPDSTGNTVLKYRYKNTIKGNIDLVFRQFSTGLTLVYHSFMERIDEAFEDKILGQEIFPGLKDYRLQNNNGDIVFDIRISYQIIQEARLSLIAKNILNDEYMGRPGDIQPPRNFTLQFLLNF